MTYTITIYNVDLLIFMLGYFVLVWILYKSGKAIKKAIGKTILKLEKKGIL